MARVLHLTGRLENHAQYLTQVDGYERTMTRSMSTLAAHFSSSKSLGTEGDLAVLQHPTLVAHNSNVPLVTSILTRFVDHAAYVYGDHAMQTSTHGIIESSSYNVQHGLETNPRYITMLLKALSALNRSLQGSCAPQTALRSLMVRHGDGLIRQWLEMSLAVP